MDMENKQKSKFFKIPIEKYEKDMDTYLMKEKKEEILDIFSNSNNLRSEKEFKEIEYQLHNACQDGDLKLIKILLSETIQNDSKDLTFKIDKANQTASLFKAKTNIKHIILPRSVKHDSTDYLITSITGTDFYIRTIKFSDDSAVKTIYRSALSGIYLEELYFPASLKELKKGWCCYTQNLTKIIISPLNGQFLFKENKYLFGKSDPNKDEFDVLLFASRDIEELNIPSNIKIISSYAFEKCKCLIKIEIPKNSNLETIESHAFSYSNIEDIFIPSKVTKIFNSVFFFCENLRKVEISKNSNLETIESHAFSYSKIEEIFIPSKVTRICESAFYNCKNLRIIEIPTDSNLEVIESHAFSYSNFERIFIPSKVIRICEYAFYNCKNLRKVEIPTDSNLEVIESHAFSGSSIEELYFPASLKELKEGWCCDTQNLTKIIISPLNGQFLFKENKYLFGKSDPNKDEFDVLLFARRDIEELNIQFHRISKSFHHMHLKNANVSLKLKFQRIPT